MARLADAFVSVTIMNHPSTANAYVYVNGRFAQELNVEAYRFDQPIPALQSADGLEEWLRTALQAVIDAL
jgi:hypothetical protein